MLWEAPPTAAAVEALAARGAAYAVFDTAAAADPEGRDLLARFRAGLASLRAALARS